MRRREIAAYVWVHQPSRRTTVRIAEGGRKKLRQLYRCSQFFSVARHFSGKAEHFRAPAFRAVRLLYDKGIARPRLNV